MRFLSGVGPRLFAAGLISLLSACDEPPVVVESEPEPESPMEIVYPAPDSVDETPNVQIELPERLEHYFRQLTLVELEQPVLARASHWGDSIIAADGLTSKIRQTLQERFGDGGHGFHLMSRYNAAYQHQSVRFSDQDWSNCLIIFKCRKDSHYGYGGVVSRSNGGASSSWAARSDGGSSPVSRFEVWFRTQPKGGKLRIKVDGHIHSTVSTASETFGDGWESIDLEDGPHQFIVTATGGAVSAYGVVLERSGPGVVWDGLSTIGAFTQRLSYQNPLHIARQMEHRKTDLLVFLLGGNDTQRGHYDLKDNDPMTPYEEEYTEVLKKYRAGRPEASCIVMSVTDHGERPKEGGPVRTRSIVPRMVESQRKVATAQGCAFFDTYAATGGEGTAARWVKKQPAWINGDYVHLTGPGQTEVARLFVGALMSAYGQYRQSQAGKPFPELQALLEEPELKPTPRPAAYSESALNTEASEDQEEGQ